MSANDLLVLDATIAESKKDRAPDMTDADYFELFAAEQILKDFDLSDEELSIGLVGGVDDAGLDGLYFLVNRQLVTDEAGIEDPKKVTQADLFLIQASQEQTFRQNRVDKLILLTEDLLDLSRTRDKLTGTYSPNLLHAITSFKERYKEFAHIQHTFKITYCYVSKGETKVINLALRKKGEQIKQKAAESFSATECFFNFIGAAELLQLARTHKTTSFMLDIAENPIGVKGQRAFICLVPIDKYFSFITEDGELRHHLFDSNVRDWQGEVKVNQAIRATLEMPGDEDFWWLNNGVTILTSETSLYGGMIKLENPQIVNGLQTSRSIYNYFKGGPPGQLQKSRNVLVRIIAPEKSESQDRIIKATNSQSPVPEYSLHATEDIHRNIEGFLRNYGLFYDRRKNYYKNQGKAISKIVEQLYLAQAVMSIMGQRPDDARARPATVLKNTDRYEAVFSSKHSLKTYLACARMMKAVDEFIKGKLMERRDRANLRFYVAMLWPCIAAKKPRPAEPDIEAALEGGVVSLDDAFDMVQAEYVRLGGSDQVAKGTELLRVLREQIDAVD